MSSLGRPDQSIRNLAFKMTDTGKVALFRVELVKVDVVLDDYTRDLLAIVRVVGRNDGKAVALRLPSELRNVVWTMLAHTYICV